MKRFLGLGLAALLAGGCTYYPNHYRLSEKPAVLPSGDTIEIGSDVTEEFAQKPTSTLYAVWRKDGKDKKLAVMRQEAWLMPPDAQRQMQTHSSADGKRAWQTVDGKTVASYDYEQAVAIIGDHGQPEWAAAK